MKRAVLLGVLAALAGVGLAATSGVLISRAALIPGSFLALTLLTTTVRALGLGRAALRYAERLTGHAAALHHGEQLRGQLFGRLARLGRDVLAFERAGDVLSRLNADTEARQMYRLRATLPLLVFAGVLALLGAWLWTLDAGLAMLGGLPLLLTGLGVLPLRARAATLARERLALGRESGARLLDALAASGDGAAGLHGPGLDQLSAELEQVSRRETGLGLRLSALQGLMFALAVTGMVWRGAGLLAQGTLSGPLLAAVVLAVAAAFDALNGLVAVPAAHAARQDALERERVLGQLQPSVQPPSSPVPLPAGPLDFELRNVGAVRAGRRVLDGVNLILKASERLAISGSSGGGKTTLARLLTRDLDPGEGEVLLGGVNLRLLDLAALRVRISVHEQEAPLLDGTLRENLYLADHRVPDTRLRGLLDRLGLAHLELDAWVGEGSTLLSGGERERVSLARALLKPSELLILDEPSAHLDPDTERRVLEVIAAELAGRALLLVSHRPAPLRLADRLLRLDHGQLSPVCQPPDAQPPDPRTQDSQPPVPQFLDTPLLAPERTLR